MEAEGTMSVAGDPIDKVLATLGAERQALDDLRVSNQKRANALINVWHQQISNLTKEIFSKLTGYNLAFGPVDRAQNGSVGSNLAVGVSSLGQNLGHIVFTLRPDGDVDVKSPKLEPCVVFWPDDDSYPDLQIRDVFASNIHKFCSTPVPRRPT